jgi:hypothetical protein
VLQAESIRSNMIGPKMIGLKPRSNERIPNPRSSSALLGAEAIAGFPQVARTFAEQTELGYCAEVGHMMEPSMIDLSQVQAELNGARRARRAVEACGNEIEALVLDMQQHAWQRLAFIDEAYDPHLFKRPN